MSTTTHATPNGVNVAQLTETVAAIQSDPKLAAFRFRAANSWVSGGHSRTTVQGFWGAGQEDGSRTEPFILAGDEPPVLLGSNRAPNAVESVLQHSRRAWRSASRTTLQRKASRSAAWNSISTANWICTDSSVWRRMCARASRTCA